MSSKPSVAGNVRAINAPVEGVDDLSIVRSLLLAPLQEKEAQIEAHIAQIQEQLDLLDHRTADYSEILAASIRKLHAQDKNLNQELEPEITTGLYKCFNEQPEKMAAALYPILGPAVRKLIASLFQGESGDIGQPYEVEQLFLIHKETSVVLSHTVLCPDATRDADLVSGMLDAIRSFVQEAFSLSEYDGMNSIKLGDLTIWVEWGPKAILAVVVRGLPDKTLQDHYAEVLRLIHLSFGSELDEFDGDITAFEALDLSAIQTEIASGFETKRSKSPPITFTHIVVLIIVLMVATANHVSAKKSWQQSLSVLADEPGIVVIEEARGWFNSSLKILRDPLSVAQHVALDRAKVDTEKVSVEWFRFQSQDPVIVDRRNGILRSFSYSHSGKSKVKDKLAHSEKGKLQP